MEKDSGKALAELAVDGGMTNSDLCMQACGPIPVQSCQVVNEM
jgi:glycerol kinase